MVAVVATAFRRKPTGHVAVINKRFIIAGCVPHDMNVKSALRWAAIYRAIVWGTGLLPLGVAAGAMYVVQRNRIPRGSGEAIGIATTPYFIVPVLLALVVWQFVETVAFYKTVTEATDEQMAERFDSEKVKSEILSVLDDRLAEMQTELERTRKQVDDLDSGGGPTTQTPTAGNTSNTGSFDFES
jgi:hypothetical protein